jgi:hypothetical protein
MVFPVTTRPRVAGPKAETANQDRKGQIKAPVENALPAMTVACPPTLTRAYSRRLRGRRRRTRFSICRTGGQESTATQNDRIAEDDGFAQLSFTRQRFTALRLIWAAPSRSSLCTGHGLGIECETARDLTPNRLPTVVTLVGRTISWLIQCVTARGMGTWTPIERQTPRRITGGKVMDPSLALANAFSPAARASMNVDRSLSPTTRTVAQSRLAY